MLPELAGRARCSDACLGGVVVLYGDTETKVGLPERKHTSKAIKHWKWLAG